MREWFASLPRELEPRAVAILGQMPPLAKNIDRSVVAVYPETYQAPALALARSASFGAEARKEGGPPLAAANLRSDDDTIGPPPWAQVWISRGVSSLFRLDVPTAFGQGMEYFAFYGRGLGEHKPNVDVGLWATVSALPRLHLGIVATRFDAVLTERERETLRLRAGGMSNQQAADVMGISHRTVEKFWASAALRLGAADGDKGATSVALMKRCAELGLF